MNILGKRELIRPSAIQTPETGKRFRNIDYNSLFIGKDIVIVLAPAGLMWIMRIYQIIAFSWNWFFNEIRIKKLSGSTSISCP